jgi:hypothetical protein
LGLFLLGAGLGLFLLGAGLGADAGLFLLGAGAGADAGAGLGADAQGPTACQLHTPPAPTVLPHLSWLTFSHCLGPQHNPDIFLFYIRT